MDALAEAVDLFAPDVWRLARRGFLVKDDLLHYVHGTMDPDEAQGLVVQVLAGAFVPARRHQAKDIDALRKAVLADARSLLFAWGTRSGRAITVASEEERALVPPGVEDLDGIVESGSPLGETDTAPDMGTELRAKRATQLAQAALLGLDEQNKKLVDLRFNKGMSALDTARELTCGAAAVRSKERRVRRRVKNALKLELKEKLGEAEIDAVIAVQATSILPPPITLERVRHEVLKRTFQEEPRPFRKRAVWGVGAAGVAIGMWALMYARILPFWADDLRLAPRIVVECASADCAKEKLKVTSPKKTHFVAVELVARKTGEVAPLLTDPSGRSIALPVGSDRALVEIPYVAEAQQIPTDAYAVAVFSKRRLTRAQIRGHVSGTRLLPKVVTATTALPAPAR
jgi:DNA-directed RNA polymerase specialized sigma24 family protein